MRWTPWHPEELAVLRATYPVSTCREVCAQLPGRSRRAVYIKAHELGLATQSRVRSDAAFLAEVRRLNGDGYPDTWIADALGCERNTVTVHRKAMGLPCQRMSELRKEAIRQTTREQCEDNGVKCLAELQQLGRRLQAFQRGWPPECTGIMCEILDYLADGPGHRRGFCAKTGRRWHRCKAATTTGSRGAFEALVKMGLVVRMGRVPFAPGKGKTQYQFRLADGVAKARRAVSA